MEIVIGLFLGIIVGLLWSINTTLARMLSNMRMQTHLMFSGKQVQEIIDELNGNHPT